MKKICDAKINAAVANQKADAHADKLRKFLPLYMQNFTVEPNVRLVKVVCRQKAFKHTAQTPFYAFAKNMLHGVILVDIKSGKAGYFDNAELSSVAEVKGEFKIGNIVYDVKDTVNNQKRYRAVGKSRQHKGMSRKEMTGLLDELL